MYKNAEVYLDLMQFIEQNYLSSNFSKKLLKEGKEANYQECCYEENKEVKEAKEDQDIKDKDCIIGRDIYGGS